MGNDSKFSKMVLGMQMEGFKLAGKSKKIFELLNLLDTEAWPEVTSRESSDLFWGIRFADEAN